MADSTDADRERLGPWLAAQLAEARANRVRELSRAIVEIEEAAEVAARS